MKTLEAKIDNLERRIGWIMLMSAISVILGLAKLYIQTSATAPSQNTNSLNIGPQSAATAGPQRDYLTTEEVATRENVSPRTVLTWIEGGRIHPTPSRSGRTWTIAPDYRIQPLIAADSR